MRFVRDTPASMHLGKHVFGRGRNSAEFSLVTINALMHHYLPEGWNVAGQSRIGIYHDTMANTFRIVGRRLDNYEVVANCAINESFTYNKATPSFHQWRDIIDDRVYGLKFGSEQDARLFAETIEKIVDSSERIARMISAAGTNNNSNSTMISSTTNGEDQLQTTSNQNGHFGNNQDDNDNNNHAVAGKTSSASMAGGDNEYGHSINGTIEQATLANNHLHSHQTTNDNNCIKSSSTLPPYQITNNDKSYEDATSNAVIQGKVGGIRMVSVPTPPPPPPPVPPHLKIAPKPKILAKPESLTNLVAAMNGSLKNGHHQSAPKPVAAANSNQNGKGNDLIDEMAQTLARRRAKIEESCGGGTDSAGNSNRKPLHHPPTGQPPPAPNGLPVGGRNFTPINGRTIQRTNSISNDNLAKNGTTTAGRYGPSNNMANGRSNSISMSNIANGTTSIISRSATNGSLRGYSPTQIDRLKEEIMDDIRQELAEFKRDLLNALRTEILANLQH